MSLSFWRRSRSPARCQRRRARQRARDLRSFNSSGDVRSRATSGSFQTPCQGNGCDNENFGDPTVVWDPSADRWVISDFAFALSAGNPVAPYFQCFAVSKTSDPVNGGWYFYSLQTNDLFPDYPKLAVWPDGLY